MRILVTGGSGFIGARLVEELRRVGHEVGTLDRRGDGGAGRDIRGDLKGLLRGWDVIYHLAAIPNPKICEEKRALAWDVNVSGSRNLLEDMGEGQHLVFASSAHVYRPLEGRHREGDELSPRSFYGLTKAVGEALVAYYGLTKTFQYTILRLFNIYGPGQKEGFLIPDVIKKYRERGEVVNRNPVAVRDFVYIEDVLEAFLRAKDTPGIYNIGTGQGTEIREVYNLVKKALGVEADERVVGGGDGSKLVADIRKAERDLGWTPKIGLEEGIERVVRGGGEDESRAGQ